MARTAPPSRQSDEPSSHAPKSGRRPRPRDEDEDEDEDEDRPRRRRSRGPNQTLIFAGAAVAVVFLVLMAGGAYLLYLALQPAPPPASPPTIPAVEPRPGPAPTPGRRSAPPSVRIPAGQADGFIVQMPGSVTKTVETRKVNGVAVVGTVYMGGDDLISCRAITYDLPGGVNLTADQFLLASPLDSWKVTGPTLATVSGRPASEYALTGNVFNSQGWQGTLRTLLVGRRVFQFQVSHNPAHLQGRADLDPAARAREFFDSVTITYDPATAPADPNRPLDASRHIDPFVTAVVLPAKGELIVFNVRGGGGLASKGVAHRYRLSDWRKVGQFYLPSPVFHAVADESAGRLYVGTVAQAVTGDARTQDTLDMTGDVQMFDLNPLLDDPKEVRRTTENTPLATAGLNDKITGLQIDPESRAVYVSTWRGSLEGKRSPQPASSRLLKLDPTTLAPLNPDIVLRQPASSVRLAVRMLRLSPDGRHLLAAPFPHDRFGKWQPAGWTGEVLLIDPVAWRESKPVFSFGIPLAATFLDDERAVVVVSNNGGPPTLYSLATGGRIVPLPTPAPLKLASVGSVVGVGGRVILSARDAGGTEVFDIGPRSATPAGHAQYTSTGQAIDGHAVVTPDGRFAVFASGAVVTLPVGR